MALDPKKLSRNELVQLLNSTALGECLTRSRLDRQMNRAGRRWHDGRHTRLLDYLRWLVREADRPAKPKADARAADLARKNTETWRSRMPEEGLEPSLCCQNGILNPARLPIPPLRLLQSILPGS